jgi:hypothetical protein
VVKPVAPVFAPVVEKVLPSNNFSPAQIMNQLRQVQETRRQQQAVAIGHLAVSQKPLQPAHPTQQALPAQVPRVNLSKLPPKPVRK